MTPYPFSKGTIMSHLIKIALASLLSGFSLGWLYDSVETWILDIPPHE